MCTWATCAKSWALPGLIQTVRGIGYRFEDEPA